MFACFAVSIAVSENQEGYYQVHGKLTMSAWFLSCNQAAPAKLGKSCANRLKCQLFAVFLITISAARKNCPMTKLSFLSTENRMFCLKVSCANSLVHQENIFVDNVLNVSCGFQKVLILKGEPLVLVKKIGSPEIRQQEALELKNTTNQIRFYR